MPAMAGRSLRWLGGVLVLALVAGLAAAWWASRVPVVPAAELAPAPLVRTLRFSGRVESASRVELGSTLTGRVAEVLVAEGATVRRDEPLLRLESDELRAARAQAQAARRQATAALAGLRSSGRNAAQAAVAQADAVRAAAEADWRRTQDLFDRGFVGQARLDDARRALAVAAAQLAAAQAQRSANAEQGAEVAQAEAQLAVAQAAVAAADARLAQAVLKAPADARVLLRHAEPGQIVQPGRALLTLALASPLQLVAPVDERFLDQLQVGQTAAVRADAFPEQRFAARVLSIAPMVDAQRGSVEVKLTPLPPVPAFLREDMTLSLDVETGRRDKALVLPLATLRGEAADGRVEVWVEHDGRVAVRRVRLGLRTLEAAEVLDGLAAGERVLIGAAVPAPGARVRGDPRLAPPAGATRDDIGGTLGQAVGR